MGNVSDKLNFIRVHEIMFLYIFYSLKAAQKFNRPTLISRLFINGSKKCEIFK